MPTDSNEFRHALGHLAAGVSVITAQVDGERPAGMTVTSFTSVSLTPPLVLVCVDRRAWLHDRLPLGQVFAVNMLAADQEAVSRRFAHHQGDPFANTPHEFGWQGAPLICGAVAAVVCRVVDRHPGGDHTILVGEVEQTRIGEGQPLLHWRGRYGHLA